jgi:hypothetical protein
MTGSAVLDAAFIRAALLSLLTGAVTTLTARQQEQSWEQALIAGAILALTTLIARAGLEGAYDTRRAVSGNMNEGDVPVASPKVEVRPTGEVGEVTVTGTVTGTTGT